MSTYFRSVSVSLWSVRSSLSVWSSDCSTSLATCNVCSRGRMWSRVYVSVLSVFLCVSVLFFFFYIELSLELSLSLCSVCQCLSLWHDSRKESAFKDTYVNLILSVCSFFCSMIYCAISYVYRSLMRVSFADVDDDIYRINIL